MKKKKISCLVQSPQHLSKLKTIQQALGDRYDFQFLIDDVLYARGRVLREASSVFLSEYPKNKTIPADPQGLPRQSVFLTTLDCISTGVSKAYCLALRYNPLPARISGVLGRFVNWMISSEWFFKVTQGFSPLQIRRIFYRGHMDQVSAYIRQEKPDMLIMAEANVEYLSQAYVRLFQKAGIPVLVTPYTFCSPSEPACYYYNSVAHQYRLFHRRYVDSKWIYRYDGRELIRMPVASMLAMKDLEIEPPQPWVQESSDADRILVESNAMSEHYLKLGIQAEKLTPIGDVAHDMLFAARKDRDSLKESLHRELEFPQKRDFVLFGVYPDCVSQSNGKIEFSSYKESVSYICDSLGALKNYNIVLCLHPSLKPEDFSYLENDHVRISRWPTTTLIAVCDLYVACISATIRWAIAMGVPVVNYDVYRFSYDDYKNVPGVVSVSERKNFDACIARLANEPSYLRELADKQRGVAHEWGVVDGQFAQRLQSLVAEMIDKRAETGAELEKRRLQA